MKDHTMVEITGLVAITAIALGGLIIDGETGNAIAMAASGGVGIFVGYIGKAYAGKRGGASAAVSP